MRKVSLGIMGCLIYTIILGACVKPVDFWFFDKDGSIVIQGEFETPTDKNAPHIVRVMGTTDVELTRSEERDIGPEPTIMITYDKNLDSFEAITVKVTNADDYDNLEWFGGGDKSAPLSINPIYIVGFDIAGKEIVREARRLGCYAITAVGEAKADGKKYSTLFYIAVKDK